MEGPIDTVTFASVERFLKKWDPGMIEREFSL